MFLPLDVEKNFILKQGTKVPREPLLRYKTVL